MNGLCGQRVEGRNGRNAEMKETGRSVEVERIVNA